MAKSKKPSLDAAKVTTDAAVDGKADHIALSELLLDESNPRFGRQAGNIRGQTAVLDYIVDSFGVDNLLSSLAINGFFSAEPLIVHPDGNGRFIVVEGNRRLAACLILADDDRASNQKHRIQAWKNQTKHPWTPDTKVPVRVYDGDTAEALLPYLGVRHLVASQPWDSYAKAKWVSDVVERGQMTIDQISQVIGDRNRTIERLLEGYNFVNQLVEEGKFNPKNSVRRGRGSNPDYPFSWVYTLLDNPGVRAWLGLGDRKQAKKDVIAAARIEDAATTLRYLFGDSSQGKNPAIDDSRQIGLLATALADAEKRAMLRQGLTAKEIDHQSKPPEDLLVDYINQSHEALNRVQSLLSSERLENSEAMKHLPRIKQVEAVVKSIIMKIAVG